MRFLRYPGGKTKQLLFLADYIPENREIKGRYIEPFVGGGSVFLFVQPKQAIISDLNKILTGTVKLDNSAEERIIKTFLSTFNKDQLLKLQNITSSALSEVLQLENKQCLEPKGIQSLHISNKQSQVSLDDINTSITNTFNNVYYLGPLREEPRAFYRKISSSNPMYVGQRGENVAFVLKYYSKKKII